MSTKDQSNQESSPNLLEIAQKGFALASNYDKARHDYPLEAVKFICENLRLLDNNTVQAKVLELGSGTGKFTRVMLEVLKDRDVQVIASDPVDEMCDHFKCLLPDVDIIQCAAEKISLPDESVDVVIAAKCFHWFANTTALEEIHRVLAPDGRFAIIWGVPDLSLQWLAEIWSFVSALIKENSLITPLDEDWKNVFGSTPQRLFSNLEENVSFRLVMPGSFEDCFEYFASYSVLINSNESCKKSFRKLCDEIKRKYFTDRGTDLEYFPINIFMYWCTKIVSLK